MSIKCIALDLDGTVLVNSQLSERNRQALMEALSAGLQVVIASGRSFDTLPEDVVTLPGITYAITSNGASIYRVPTGERLHGVVLTAASVEAIVAATRSDPVVYEAFIEGKAYADAKYVQSPRRYGASPQAVAYIQSTRTLVPDMTGFLAEHQTELESLDVIVSGADLKQAVWQKLERTVPDIYITSSVPQLIEISHRDAGKHTGLAYIAKLLGIRMSEIAAFGNGDNDCEMLESAGIGYAVADASARCLQAADRIVGPCGADGAADGIEEILRKEIDTNEEEGKER